MPTNLISFPFRITNNGNVATKIDGDDDYYAEELAVLISIDPGERILVPTYGLDDPSFDTFPIASLLVQVAKFGPPVTIIDVESTLVDQSRVDIQVYFDSNVDAADTDLGG